jgi:pimeloyl-ACP methyl ester carboxylesterase
MNDIELTCVDTRHLESTLIDSVPKLKEENQYVSTRYGKVFVTIQGNREKTAFLTFPDIGLTSHSQFHGFFNYVDNEPLMDSFCAYHINPIGQEEGSPSLPANYSYPTLDQLAETVLDVYNHFKLKSVICFGIGLGANVLSRFALSHPDLVNGIVLINCCSTKCGWVEWGYQKWNRWYLSSGQYTEFTNNYLLWHHFGYQTWEKNHDLIETYSRVFSKSNPINLSHLINAYINRTDLGIQRNDFENEPNVQKFNFKCSILNVMGDHSPHEDDVVETNGRLNPTKSSFVKFADCGGMVLEEQPAKMSESLRHFLQGLGYVPHLSITRHSLAYRNSDMAIKQKELLKRASLNDSSFGSSIAVHLDDTKSFANVPSSNVNA